MEGSLEAPQKAALHGGGANRISQELSRELPPGPHAPGWVQTSQWMFRPIEFMERCRKRYGPIFTIRLGPAQNVVMVGTPEVAKQVIAGDPSVLRAGVTNDI